MYCLPAENTLASRFASYLQNMHFDEEYSEMETPDH